MKVPQVALWLGPVPLLALAEPLAMRPLRSAQAGVLGGRANGGSPCRLRSGKIEQASHMFANGNKSTTISPANPTAKLMHAGCGK
jgi:hypothetical protein